MKIIAQLYVDGDLVLEENNSFCRPREELVDRDDRLHHAIHAEMSILTKDKFDGYKVLVMNLTPCWDCAKVLSISDINEIWIPCEIPERWRHEKDNCVDGYNLLIESGKKIKMLPMNSGEDLPSNLLSKKRKIK